MRFRFLPTVMGHPLVGRMSEGGWDRELVKAADFYGWQYSLMSALAVSGSIMPAILPYECDLLPGYKEFYRKWTAWAAANFEYVPYTEPFGEQVQPGAVDGYARIKGDHGFVFLFNGNPRPSRIEFEVGDEINLQQSGDYEFAELYPAEGTLVLDDQGRSVFAWGDKASLTVPANACRLLELWRVAESERPVLAGIAGQVVSAARRLDITAARRKPGHVYPIHVRLPGPDAIEAVRVNGIEQPFARAGNEIRLQVHFAGEPHVRELDRWVRPDGSVFRFPNAERQASLEVAAKFKLNENVRRLLENARPKSFAEMDPKIAAWQTSGDVSYSYHNFTCCRPNRLWLVVPFTLQRVGELRIAVNARDAAGMLRRDRHGHAFYLDVTDLVEFGQENEIRLSARDLEANEFLGPFLIYPDEGLTGEVLPRASPPETPVVFTGSLVPPPPRRYAKDARRPVIVEAVASRNVTLNRPTQLRVRVDLPPEKLQAVKFSESGFPWMGIGSLAYDRELNCWVANLRPGSRAAIQESEYVYVWAVGSDGLWSDFFPVKIGWDFTTGAANLKTVPGAIEGESLKVLSKTRGRVEPQDMLPFGDEWSGGRQLVWWGGLEAGDRLVLEVPVQQAGMRALILHVSKAEDYGIFSFRVDDGPETAAIDFFHPRLLPPVCLEVKPPPLAAGNHRLTITYHGKNAQSRNSLIGLDCLQLRD